jgi:hypothetical protein
MARKVSSTDGSDARAGTWTVGRRRFARISAVEGIALSPEARRQFERFDRDGYGSARRRAEIIWKYAKPPV